MDDMRGAIDDRLASLPEAHPVSATIPLPPPASTGAVSVEEALRRRRSERKYEASPLSLGEVGQLLWAAYGTTKQVPGGAARYRGGFKTAPSAGALYPLEIYVVAGDVQGLASAVYRYRPEAHELERIADGDRRADLCAGAHDQQMIRHAPASLVFTALYDRTTSKYGGRGRDRYVCMDLGHAAQNVYLQCVPLGLGTTAIGAFQDVEVQLAVHTTRPEVPLYIMPIGRLAATQE